MDQIIINGGRRLEGTIPISGSKNATLAILAAALASKGTVRLHNVPEIGDIATMFDLFGALNCDVHLRPGTGEVTLDPGRVRTSEAPACIVNRMRASFNVLGPLLARFGEARVGLPGGCDIGARPVNYHLKGLEDMGAEIRLTDEYVEARAPRLHGAHILLEFPSVTTTTHLMTTACLAEGRTVIEHAAEEPEVVDTAAFLCKMGARIFGAGTDTIEIEGASELGDCDSHSVIPDRMEAGTYAMAATITGGQLLLQGAVPEHMTATILKLRDAGAEIELLGHSIRKDSLATAPRLTDIYEPAGRMEEGAPANGIIVSGPKGRPNALNVITQTHPGFPTDMQQPLAALLTLASGCSTITETLFEHRFNYMRELHKMGANVRTDNRSAVIMGVEKLHGARVQASDLRAGAALVLAGLAAEGETIIERVDLVDRGYGHLVEKLAAVGAEISRHRVADPATRHAAARPVPIHH